MSDETKHNVHVEFPNVGEPKIPTMPTPPEHILQFFAYDHLPPHLAAVSRPFAVLAHDLVGKSLFGDDDPTRAVPRNPERTVALRKLLEAKDAAVRALLAKP